jgi:diadenosine tetraphosphatase ApaH/serine/threonine PP2A family protein phosphatase
VLALLYDVHGNLPALEAVLADAAGAGADRFLLGGDYTLFGAWPAETVARLQELSLAAQLRGNGERWTAAPAQAPDDPTVQGALGACAGALGGPAVARLAALPEQTVIEGARYCHASVISDVRSFLPAAAEEDEQLLGDATETRLVFGHTHLPFRRRGPRDVELVNPGSVGMPFDGDPRAAYALVHADGAIEHRRVSYDHRASARAVEQRFDGDWTATIAARIHAARVDPQTPRRQP